MLTSLTLNILITLALVISCILTVVGLRNGVKKLTILSVVVSLIAVVLAYANVVHALKMLG